MNPSKTTLFGLLALIVGALTLTLYAQDRPRAAAASWEHLALTVDAKRDINDPELGTQINQLGGEGWELFDVESRSENGTTTGMIYFFKRSK